MRILLFMITIINLNPIFGSLNDLPTSEIVSHDLTFKKNSNREEPETSSESDSSESKSSNRIPTEEEIAELCSIERCETTEFTPQKFISSVDWENLHKIYKIFASNANLSSHMGQIRFPLPKKEVAALHIEYLYNQYGFKKYSYEWMFASYAYTALMGNIPDSKLAIHNYTLEQAALYSGKAASFLSLLYKNNLGQEPTSPYADIEMYRHSYAYFAALRAQRYGVCAAWNIIANTGYPMGEISN